MILLNTRYYHWVDDELEEIKIIKHQSNDNYKAIYTQGKNSGNPVIFPESHIKENFTKLKPDGFLSISILKVGKLRDVAITLSTEQDVVTNIPQVVCRQCVNDVFAEQSKIAGEFFGISISQDTCPANVDFRNYLSCDGMEKNDSLAFYIGDKLDDLLSLIRLKDYDIALYNLFVDRCKVVANNINYIVEQYKQKRYINGYCKTVKDLAKINNFVYDLQRTFNIIPFNLDLEMCIGQALDPIALKELSSLLCKNIDKSIVIKYDKSIDLKSIERSYQLISDASENVYIVAYTTAGTYHIPVEDVESADNIEKLNNTAELKSVKDAYNNLLFDTSKYK